MPRNAASAVALVLSAAVAADAARSVGHGRQGAFLSLRSDLQPQSVALTLARVEQDWREQATAFARCNVTGNGSAGCQASSGRFQTSCATVVTAVVQASSGKREVVQEYLNEVCAQKGLEGWRGQACSGLASALLDAMSPNAYTNREGVDAAVPCQRFWQSFIADEVVRFEKEQAEEQAEERRRAEAAAKVQKAAQEAAAAEAKAKQEHEAEAEALRAAEAERVEKEAATNATRQRILSAAAQAQDQEHLADQNLEEAQATIDAAAQHRAALRAHVARGAAAPNATAPSATPPNATADAANASAAQPALEGPAVAAEGPNATRAAEVPNATAAGPDAARAA